MGFNLIKVCIKIVAMIDCPLHLHLWILHIKDKRPDKTVVLCLLHPSVFHKDTHAAQVHVIKRRWILKSSTVLVY